jgi:acyl-CoA dehydrogenase
VTYPKDYVKEAAKRNLLGLRFSPEYKGRELQWQDEMVNLNL